MKNIYLISGGPGDVELLTLKAKRIIDNADYIFSSNKYIDEKTFVDVKEDCIIYDTFSKNADEKIELCKKVVEENKIIAFVTMGDTSLYGMIGGLVDRLEKNDLDFEIIPGVSSFNASSAILKRGFTGLGITNTAICTTLKDIDDPKGNLETIASLDATVALFMAVNQIHKVVEIFSKYHSPDYPISVISKASWDSEKIIVSDLENIENEVKKNNIDDGIILIGEFINKEYDYDLEYRFEERMRIKREKNKKIKTEK